MKWFKTIGLFLTLLVLVTPVVGAQDFGQTPVQPEKLWDKTYIIISLNDLKTIQDWDYIIKTMPKDHKGIMIMWYGITQDYQNDFKIVQNFINQYKKAYPDKSVIELWMKTQIPTGDNQTVNITTPVFDNVDYIITFDNVKDVVNSIPKDKDVKIIASYVYEKKEIPIKNNQTNTTTKRTLINEQPKWEEIQDIKKQDSRLTGVMIYTNDNNELVNLIQRAKADGFETYTIILPTPTLFGGVDMVSTFQKIQGALKIYDYALFYSWTSITPDFNYFMSGGMSTGQLPQEELSKWGKVGQWLPEVALLMAVVVGIGYSIYRKKKGKIGEVEEKKETKKKSKNKKKESSK